MAAPRSLPPGVYFHPSPDECVRDYLRPWIKNGCDTETPPWHGAVFPVDIYKHQPGELAQMFPAGHTRAFEKNWYFLAPRRGSKKRRVATGGYWKVEQKTQGVGADDGGKRRAFGFYLDDKHKTPWLMEELTVDGGEQSASLPMFCRIYVSPRAGIDDRRAALREDCVAVDGQGNAKPASVAVPDNHFRLLAERLPAHCLRLNGGQQQGHPPGVLGHPPGVLGHQQGVLGHQANQVASQPPPDFNGYHYIQAAPPPPAPVLPALHRAPPPAVPGYHQRGQPAPPQDVLGYQQGQPAPPQDVLGYHQQGQTAPPQDVLGYHQQGLPAPPQDVLGYQQVQTAPPQDVLSHEHGIQPVGHHHGLAAQTPAVIHGVHYVQAEAQPNFVGHYHGQDATFINYPTPAPPIHVPTHQDDPLEKKKRLTYASLAPQPLATMTMLPTCQTEAFVEIQEQCRDVNHGGAAVVQEPAPVPTPPHDSPGTSPPPSLPFDDTLPLPQPPVFLFDAFETSKEPFLGSSMDSSDLTHVSLEDYDLGMDSGPQLLLDGVPPVPDSDSFTIEDLLKMTDDSWIAEVFSLM